jgi:hypothetical protein
LLTLLFLPRLSLIGIFVLCRIWSTSVATSATSRRPTISTR